MKDAPRFRFSVLLVAAGSVAAITALLRR